MSVATLFCIAAVFDFSLVALFSYLIWLLIVAFLCGLLFRPKLQITPRRSEYSHVGQTLTISYHCTNAGKLPAYDLLLRFRQPPAGVRLVKESVVISALEPGATEVIEFQAIGTQRGEFAIPDLQAICEFPLGLFRFISTHRLEQELTIAPACSTDLELATQVNSSEHSAISFGHQKSRSLEYIGSREFQPGVPVRRWDFSSWARMGKPAVREFSEGRSSAAVVLYDDSRNTSGIDDLLEARLSAAASAIETLLSSDLLIQLLPAHRSLENAWQSLPAQEKEKFMRQLAVEPGHRQDLAWESVMDKLVRMTEKDTSVIAILSDNEALAVLSKMCAKSGRHLIARVVDSANGQAEQLVEAT